MECLPYVSFQEVSRRVEEKYNTGDKGLPYGVLHQKSICGKAMRTNTKGRKMIRSNPKPSCHVGGHASSCHHHSSNTSKHTNPHFPSASMDLPVQTTSAYFCCLSRLDKQNAEGSKTTAETGDI